MEQVHLKGPCLDQKGIGEIFDRFDALGDRVRKIVCGGRRVLKPFQQHRCFERARYGAKKSEGGELLKGCLFDAEVFTSNRIDTNLIRVFGTATEEPIDGGFGTETRPRHSFELVFRKS